MIWISLAVASTPLELADVVVSVETQHPQLASAAARVQMAESEVVAANGAFDPVLGARIARTGGDYDAWTAQTGVSVPLTAWGGDATVGWRRGVGEFAAYDGALETSSPGVGYLTVTLPTLRDGLTDRRRAAARRADLDVSVATAEAEIRRFELLRAASHRYWDWVGAAHRLRVHADLLALAEARDQALQRQVDIGDLAPIVREDNRRLVLDRRDRLIQARRAFAQSQLELSLHLRDADGEPLLASEAAVPDLREPQLPNEKAAAARALDTRPEIDRVDAQRSQIGVDLRLARNQVLPALDLTGTLEGPSDPDWKAGVRVEWPVPARAARGRIGAARAGLARADADLAWQEDRVLTEISDSVSAYLAWRERAVNAVELVQAANNVATAERARFELGDSNLLFVNQRELAAAESSIAAIDAVVGGHKSVADWRWATAAPVWR